ncbi:hypothetical protein [Phenylobacterium sp.]|uniref:hypothetical protein n=1 Tax=Phenylobacterium sp. TaxID=1871053 RepID=UPI0035690C6F
MTADPDDPDDKPSFLPADHLAAIGRIANAWAYLEFAIDNTTWQLAGVPDMVGACMTAQMFSIQPKMRALISLAELRGISAATLSRLRKFNGDRIGGLQEARNRSVHDTRVMHTRTGKVTRLQVTAHGPLVFGFQFEPIAELHKIRKRVEQAVQEYLGLRDELLAEFRALPEKSGRQLDNIRPGHGDS